MHWAFPSGFALINNIHHCRRSTANRSLEWCAFPINNCAALQFTLHAVCGVRGSPSGSDNAHNIRAHAFCMSASTTADAVVMMYGHFNVHASIKNAQLVTTICCVHVNWTWNWSMAFCEKESMSNGQAIGRQVSPLAHTIASNEHINDDQRQWCVLCVWIAWAYRASLYPVCTQSTSTKNGNIDSREAVQYAWSANCF